MDTSTHNSGVIHAGLYYPAGSLKARLCVEGRDLMYEFCARYGVPHVRSGKLIVAHDEHEVRELEVLQQRGAGNGVAGLEIVDRAFILSREPAVNTRFALWSPDSGIVNAEEFVKALLRTGTDAGVMFLPGTKLIGADHQADGMVLTTERESILARVVVNAAGLYADDVSRLLGGETFTIYPCRGEYAEFTPAKRSLVNGLVYPLPHRSGHGLGVHLVRTTGGQVWLGPTMRYQERKDDYENDREPLEAFAESARRLIDGVTVDDLRLSGSGIRAKLHPPSESFADFLIRRDRVNPAIVQASGIDSPGLTSSLAIGNLVRDLTGESM
jgi:L-2-hydroxyglutarate oxidase LhgO